MAMAIAIVSLAACSDSKIDENQPTGGNGGGSSKDYNINDKSFSQSNWRNQDKIYIFDQKSTDIKDDNGQTGYNTINLPWSSSVVNTNLPPNFCDAITPENGSIEELFPDPVASEDFNQQEQETTEEVSQEETQEESEPDGEND